MKTENKTIVSFHIGRGGKYNNLGHTTFLGIKDISNYTNDLFLEYENLRSVYKDYKNYPNILEAINECVDSDDLTFTDKLNIDLGEKIYTRDNGIPVGLTLAEAESGIGCINIDNEYDTTYSCYLELISDTELSAIIRSNQLYDREEALIEYAKILKFQDYEIELMRRFDDWNQAINIFPPQFSGYGDRIGAIYGKEVYEVIEADIEESIDLCYDIEYTEMNNKIYIKR